MVSDLVDYECPPMPEATGLQPQNPATAARRLCFSSSVPTAIVVNSRGGSTKPRYRVSKPPITRGKHRSGLLVSTVPAQECNVGSCASTSTRAHTLRLHPEPWSKPTDCVPHTTYLRSSWQQNMHPQLPQGPKRTGGSYDKAFLLQRLDEHFRLHNQGLNGYADSRKILLQEAIQNNDGFYLVLSQVFCLFTCQNSSVAGLLKDVLPQSWLSLGTLLCSNDVMTKPVVECFAEFPAPVENILCSGWRHSFLEQLESVKRFLRELPDQLESMRRASIESQAPPLTQEMVERYNLVSPVIQTIIFRVMARSFWGPDDRGLEFLTVLHKLDQGKYTKEHWKRSAAENNIARGFLRYVYCVWQTYRSQPEARTEQFMIPDAYKFFGELPPSMQPTTNNLNEVDGGSGQFSRGAAWRRELTTTQQIQTIDMSRRPFHPSRLVLEPQQMPSGGNNSVAAQQFLSQSSRQYHQHQPMQPCQPYSGRLSDDVVMPVRGVAQSRYREMPVPSNHRPSTPLWQRSGGLVPLEDLSPGVALVQPDTARVSLHQAHLRSPIPGNRKLLAGSEPLYQHVTRCALPPTQLNNKLCAQSTTLSVSQADLNNIPSSSSGLLPGEPRIRTLQEGSVLYRLRCCEILPAKKLDNEACWMTAINTWPSNHTFELNGTYLEPRHWLHHGHCLPIDLSALLRVGINSLNVYTIPNPSAPTTNSYAIAVEQVSVSSHASILSAINLISAEDSLAAIKCSISISPDEDDDIAMTSSTLTIQLFDPYRNDRICDTPVRGSACLHRECFDLETFLSQCKREQPGYPCVPDCWRCPICKSDVRPQTLVKDGFLAQVKKELAQKGLLETRSITVEADGSWKPEVGARLPEVRSADSECGKEAAMAGAGCSKSSVKACGQGKQRVVEVIELD